MQWFSAIFDKVGDKVGQERRRISLMLPIHPCLLRLSVFQASDLGRSRLPQIFEIFLFLLADPTPSLALYHSERAYFGQFRQRFVYLVYLLFLVAASLLCTSIV